MGTAEELLYSEQIASSVKKAKVVLICGETASPKLVESFMEELSRNGFQNVTPVQCENYKFNVDMTFDLAIALNCTLQPLSKCLQFNGKLITAEVSGSLFRLFVDLGRNHRFDVLLSGDKPHGTEFTKIHPGNLTVVVCDKPHGLRTGQTCELSANLSNIPEGYSSTVEVLTDKTFAVDVNTAGLLSGGRDDTRTGEQVVVVSGFVRPASSALATSFESLASQLRKHPKFDSCNEFEIKELKKSHALLNVYLGYCSYSRKKGTVGGADDFSKLVASGQADFGSLFDICFLQAEDLESVSNRFHLFSSMAQLSIINRLAASLTVVEAVKAVSHKLEPLQQWLIVDWSDMALLENAQSKLGEKNIRVLVVSGVTSVGKAVAALVKEQLNGDVTVVEDIDRQHALYTEDDYLKQFDAVVAAGCHDQVLDSLRQKAITHVKPLVVIRFGGPGELISAVDVTVPSVTDLPVEVKPLVGGSFSAPPYCVIKHFPNQISHCILWGIDKFESLFRAKPEVCNKFIEAAVADGGKGTADDYDLSSAVTLVHYLFNTPSAASSFDDCLYMARVKFEKYFDFKARQLVFNFPPDHKQDDGKMFWALPRQLPRPLDFDELIVTNGPARSFLVAGAELFAAVYNVAIPDNVDEAVAAFLASDRAKTLPNFIPKQKRIDVSESVTTKKAYNESRTRSPLAKDDKAETTEGVDGDNTTDSNGASGELEDSGATIQRALQLVRNLAETGLKSSKHLGVVKSLRPDQRQSAAFRFIQAAANLRASMYGVGIGSISPGQLAKFIAANRSDSSHMDSQWTLPAVEYFAAELAAAELLKIFTSSDSKPEDDGCPADIYRTAEMNFSKSLGIHRAKPNAVSVNVLNEKCSFSCWDKWNFEATETTTVAELVGDVETRYSVKVTAVVQGARPIYFPLLGHADRLAKPVVQFIDANPSADTVLLKENITTVRFTLLLEPPAGAAMDAEDVESPPVYIDFLKK